MANPGGIFDQVWPRRAHPYKFANCGQRTGEASVTPHKNPELTNSKEFNAEDAGECPTLRVLCVSAGGYVYFVIQFFATQSSDLNHGRH